MVDANVRARSGEIDLLALDRRERVAVEVRTISGTADPIDAVDEANRALAEAASPTPGKGNGNGSRRALRWDWG